MSDFERFPRYRPRNPPEWWYIDNSDVDDYLEDFTAIDIDGKVAETLDRIQFDPMSVIIDLMASTRAMESLHKKGFKGRLLAIGVNKDSRVIDREFDFYKDIRYRVADLGTSYGWGEVDELMDGEKADLIMERSYGGLHYISNNLSYYKIAVSRVWDRLKPNGGLAVLQTPPKNVLLERGVEIDKWTDRMNSNGIYARFGELKNSRDSGLDYGFLILQKSAPDQRLPVVR